MKKRFASIACIATTMIIATAGVASADPVDNPGLTSFIWYNNPGSPFFDFGPSGKDYDSYEAPLDPASYFEAVT